MGFREVQCAPFFTYAGDVDFSMMCIHRIAKRMEQTEKRHAAEDVLMEEVRKIHKEYYYAYNSHNGNELQLIVGFRQADSRVALYRVLGGSVPPGVTSASGMPWESSM